MNAIGKNLREARTSNQMSQEDVSNHLNISRQSISRWENDRGYPDIEKLIKLSSLYNVTIDSLLLGVEDRKKNSISKIGNEPNSSLKTFLIFGCLGTLIGHALIMAFI
ncbi:helix-turn-helix domain-containing protein [Levilactobacillus angrenensis]|uniref:Helix-turn-helix domain-containing protein n=1 Tax=Levilactobacillus angrenensis TaxID=2486020 RepID=A0ABW1U5V6_9LACO|nr:helix-turn-helix transcriptional regulator [Levilactobacillus angrenensis]